MESCKSKNEQLSRKDLILNGKQTLKIIDSFIIDFDKVFGSG